MDGVRAAPSGGPREDPALVTAAETQSERADEPSAPAELDDDVVELTFPQLARHRQATPLSPPIQNPPLLPLAALDPEVLERVVAELVSGQQNRGVQFYGRRGQKQHGLDIVERELTASRSLYQVKRYASITPEEIREAVEAYAGPPRPPDYSGTTRKFDPRRFVVVTSAELDREARNVDEVATLQDEYGGDVDIEVWGAEALSRKLRSAPHLVNAVFGPVWASSFCGLAPVPTDRDAPKSLGLVESPITLLHLDTLEADAAAVEGSDPLRAAPLLGAVAQGLKDGNFPGHAAAMCVRQAKAALAGGDKNLAFLLLYELALERVLAGEDFVFDSIRHDLDKMSPGLDAVQGAKLAVLQRLADWYERGSDLATTVPALQLLAAEDESDASLLGCLVLEQALVDGLYDFVPAFSIMIDVDEDTARLLSELRDLADRAQSSDAATRARLRCAVADATLTADASLEDVDGAYGQLVSDALAGRYLHARGLVTARAARAFAIGGDTERANSNWRQSILASSEDGFYGDVRGAMRASSLLTSDSGIIELNGLRVVTSALPNRRRLLAGARDPALGALEAAHRNKLPDAFGDARRHYWEGCLAGHFLEELLALALFGDVLSAGERPVEAIQAYVMAGEAKKAVELTRGLPEPVDVRRWLVSAVRRRRAAAVQVVGAQSATVHDGDVGEIVDALLQVAQDLWTAPFSNPLPELDALKAVGSFGFRIPEAAVDPILSISGPALTANTRASDEVADLLMQTYWAVASRREDLGNALALMLRLKDPPHNLWGLVQAIPEPARGPLLPVVVALGAEGRPDAVETLASWRVVTDAVQLSARAACAALLRLPVGIPRTSRSVGTQESVTVDLLLALLDAEDLVEVPLAELGSDKARPAGGMLYSTSFVSPTEPGSEEMTTDASVDADLPTESSAPKAQHDESEAEDRVAMIAAGPPEDLAVAVAGQLAAMTEDHHGGAASRARAVAALRLLVERLPAGVAGQLASRLAVVHETPKLSDEDLWEIGSDGPLSRFRFSTGANLLAGLALVTSAEAFAVSRAPEEPVTDADRSYEVVPSLVELDVAVPRLTPTLR